MISRQKNQVRNPNFASDKSRLVRIEEVCSILSQIQSTASVKLYDKILYHLIWYITEGGGKYNTRFRSNKALNSKNLRIHHEHVFPISSLKKEITQKPSKIRILLKRQAIACIVTEQEHSSLNGLPKNIVGWDRYKMAGINVKDMKTNKTARINQLIKYIVTYSIILIPFFSSGQEIPCRRNYPANKGGGCIERYNEDGNGEKHGKYISYAEDGSVIERGNYVHSLKQGNWFQTSSNANDWARSVLLGYSNTPNSWFENGEYIISSTNPINSYQEALKLKRELENEEKKEKERKEAEQKRHNAAVKAHRDSLQLVQEAQEREEAEKQKLANIEWSYDNDPCLFLEIASGEDNRREEAIKKCEQRKLENTAFKLADNSWVYKTYNPYDGQNHSLGSYYVILLQGYSSYYGESAPRVYGQENPDDDIIAIERKIEGFTKYLFDFPGSYRKGDAEILLKNYQKQESRWIEDIGKQYPTFTSEITSNVMSGTNEGYKNALEWWKILNKMDRSSNNNNDFSRWKVLLLSGYIIAAKWALNDIDGAKAIYNEYQNIKVPTHGGINDYFQAVDLPQPVSLGNALLFGEANVDFIKYNKYFEAVYKKVAEKISLPDSKVNYKKITTEK